MPRVIQRTQALVTIAIGLALLHTIDEAWWHPEDGGKANFAATIIIGGLLVAFAARIPALWRAVVFCLLGLEVTVVGTAGHLVHVVNGDAHGADWSGFLFVAGGLILLGVGITSYIPRNGSNAEERIASP